MQKLLRFLRSEDGPTSVEYAVLLALILGTIFGSLTLVGSPTLQSFEDSRDRIEQATSTP